MTDHYQKVYELPGGLCAADAPVLIRSGALLLDERKQNLLLQLKFYNLESDVIRGLTVRLDFPGCSVEPVLRSYNRLRAGQDQEFGEGVLLPVPYAEARSFRVAVAEVRFADGSFWRDSGAPWKPIPRAQTLAELYGEDCAQHFRTCYGTDCVYAPVAFRDLWQCTCGVVNHKEDARCRRCRRIGKAYLAIDIAALREESDRIAAEERMYGEDSGRDERPGSPWRTFSLLLLGIALIALVILFAPRVLEALIPPPAVTAPVTERPVFTLPPSIAPPPTPTPTQSPAPTLTPEQQQLKDYRDALDLLDSARYSEARAAFLRLGDFRESEKFAKEAIYRKASGLLQFIRDYDEQDIYALVSMEVRGTNRFSLSKSKALALGSDAIASLREACGGDTVDITFTDEPSGTLKPLASCVKALFMLLDGYADSEACLEELEWLTDYTRDFYMLLEAGDIYGASEWLHNYHGTFTGYDHWMQLLELYKPFCDDWELFSGDPTLLPMTTEEHSLPCYSFNSRVIISGETATLRLLFTEGEGEYFVDLTADAGSTQFMFNRHGIFYFAEINRSNHFAYFNYYGDGMQGSVEYNRAAK